MVSIAPSLYKIKVIKRNEEKNKLKLNINNNTRHSKMVVIIIVIGRFNSQLRLISHNVNLLPVILSGVVSPPDDYEEVL